MLWGWNTSQNIGRGLSLLCLDHLIGLLSVAISHSLFSSAYQNEQRSQTEHARANTSYILRVNVVKTYVPNLPFFSFSEIVSRTNVWFKCRQSIKSIAIFLIFFSIWDWRIINIVKRVPSYLPYSTKGRVHQSRDW